MDLRETKQIKQWFYIYIYTVDEVKLKNKNIYMKLKIDKTYLKNENI